LRSGFYDLIDEHLREPCLMLHKAGFATLPSCEGHFHGRSYFAEVWQTLQWENEQIRGSGLVLHNSETNELVRFADSAYELPWPNFAGFLEELTRTQVGGYLGVELRREHRHIARELSRSPYQENAATIGLERPAEGVWIAAVYVDPLNPEHGASTWKKAGGYLRRLVHLPERHMVVSAPA